MKIHGTAKGGALSTKDFGVAFGAPVPVSTFTIDDSNRNGNRTIGYSGSVWRAFAGVKNAIGAVTLVGAKVFLDNDNDAGTAGNVQLVVYASDGSNKRQLGDDLLVSGLNSTMTEKPFTGSVSVDVDDLIGVTIDSGATTAHKFNVGMFTTTDQIDSVTTWQINNTGVLSEMDGGGTYRYLCGLELSYTA